MLGLIVGREAEGLSGGAGASADLGPQDHSAAVRTLWVHPAVIVPVAVDGGHDHGLRSGHQTDGRGDRIAPLDPDRDRQPEASREGRETVAGGGGPIGGEAGRDVGPCVALADQTQRATDAGFRVLHPAEGGQGAEPVAHGGHSCGKVHAVAVADGHGLGRADRHGHSVPSGGGAFIRAPKAQADKVAGGHCGAVVAQGGPQDGAGIGGGIAQHRERPAATGRSHRHIQAAMAGPIKAAATDPTTALGRPGTPLVSHGRSGQPLAFGQFQEARDKGPRGGRPRIVRRASAGKSPGGQVVEDQGAGEGGALPQLWVAAVGGEQVAHGQPEADQQGGHIAGYGAGGVAVNQGRHGARSKG